ncbi:MAG: DNA gyrase inhibitor YacG [Sedimentisphaerales bacterium]|nr:DNA gyrase inhibitor YacG [Sedimentisphaerales bacterium]
MKHRCPICHKPIEPLREKNSQNVKFFPFCSRRCKLLDLGVWLDAEYKVISEPTDQSPDSPTQQ